MSVDDKYFSSTKYLVYSDDRAVMIAHPQPISKFHFVTTPQKTIQAELCRVNKKSVEMINHLQHVTNVTIKRVVPKGSAKFVMGFIATELSGCNLHLHTVSNDFAGSHVSDENWNLFTTDIFIPIEDVLESLQVHGHFDGPTDSQIEHLLNADVRCVHCDLKYGNFSALKDHLKSHAKGLVKQA